MTSKPESWIIFTAPKRTRASSSTMRTAGIFAPSPRVIRIPLGTIFRSADLKYSIGWVVPKEMRIRSVSKRRLGKVAKPQPVEDGRKRPLGPRVHSPSVRIIRSRNRCHGRRARACGKNAPPSILSRRWRDIRASRNALVGTALCAFANPTLAKIGTILKVLALPPIASEICPCRNPHLNQRRNQYRKRTH
jgi:hypothetical protein